MLLLLPLGRGRAVRLLRRHPIEGPIALRGYTIDAMEKRKAHSNLIAAIRRLHETVHTLWRDNRREILRRADDSEVRVVRWSEKCDDDNELMGTLTNRGRQELVAAALQETYKKIPALRFSRRLNHEQRRRPGARKRGIAVARALRWWRRRDKTTGGGTAAIQLSNLAANHIQGVQHILDIALEFDLTRLRAIAVVLKHDT